MQESPYFKSWAFLLILAHWYAKSMIRTISTRRTTEIFLRMRTIAPACYVDSLRCTTMETFSSQSDMPWWTRQFLIYVLEILTRNLWKLVNDNIVARLNAWNYRNSDPHGPISQNSHRDWRQDSIPHQLADNVDHNGPRRVRSVR